MTAGVSSTVAQGRVAVPRIVMRLLCMASLASFGQSSFAEPQTDDETDRVAALTVEFVTSDWPGIRGPEWTGHSSETGIADSWPVDSWPVDSCLSADHGVGFGAPS